MIIGRPLVCCMPDQTTSGRGKNRRSSRPSLGTTIRSPKGWRCITQHFVLCVTYSSLVQEYSAVVTCHVNVALEGEPATCPPPRPRGSHATYYLPLGRKLRKEKLHCW